MASISSSSSVLTVQWTYEVFLSFRGEDTRYTFIDHLHSSLVQRGIRVFKDDEMLRRGKSIAPELLKAIEESKFAVVVFSKNYANSSWCLDELVKIMECETDLVGHRVLPVFYHVDPSDVRGQKGDFAAAFYQHEDKLKGEMHKVTKWRKALTAAANLSGYHISETHQEGESVFVTKIVKEIFDSMEPQVLEHNLIDIEPRIDGLYRLLKMEAREEVHFVGIHGMGGIGKTTIAQALYTKIARKFEGSSFVNDVRENSSRKRDICALQEQILKDILAIPQMFKVRNPEEGAGMIRSLFRNKNLLLVLDDVDNVRQLEFLAAEHDWFGPGSRIIITTRDEHVLSDANAKYKPPLFRMNQAIELFSRHAFKRNSPPEGYEVMSRRAVSYTGYLPLAIKIFGSYFRGREPGVWESALARLANTPTKDIFETLKLSFDGLDNDDKQIFLDIACFFKGKDEEHVTRLIDSFGFEAKIGISVLIEKSFLTVSDKKIHMHDLIQEMGTEIVQDSFPNSRFWKREDIYDFIMKNKKLKAIEATMAHNNTSDEQLSLDAHVFKSMKNLRLLDVYEAFTYGEPSVLPYELRWLSWNGYPFSSVPLEDMPKLVGLEMKFSQMEQLWEGKKVMQNLKYINLHCSFILVEFPDVSGAPNIERLTLTECENLVSVHESLGFLKKLVYMDMRDCKKLKCLPPMIDTQSLQTLILDGCSEIEELPSSFASLSNLSLLSLEACLSLKNIPEDIHELKNLITLRLNDCPKLKKLPDEFGSFEKLEELQLGLMHHFRKVDPIELWRSKSISFHAFTNLWSLKKLDLSLRQIGEEDFPEDLNGFSALEELHLSGNSKLFHLPTSLSHLSRLKHLELNYCNRLKDLYALPSAIEVLKAYHCDSLENTKYLSTKHVSLYKIWLYGCKTLLNEENKICIDEMLEQSFLMKWASADACLSIAIPGGKVPSWFEHQQHGNKITLRLPPNWQTRIMGFAICGIFRHSFQQDYPYTVFRFQNDGNLVPESGLQSPVVDEAHEDDNVCIGYVPLSRFEQAHDGFEVEDWSPIIEGNLVVTIGYIPYEQPIRCGVKVVYKEDVESIQAHRKYHWNWDLMQSSPAIFLCIDKPMLAMLKKGLEGT